ncbi:protein translocase subunit SecD [Caulobacter vibrioides]|uniref:Protein translocase subunit SecD n=2 Tax=Caulobacter vibrioides TaxID=155892 RepID=Q9A6U2_CAUVC|nr:protein translocase subunit SecD [Caulobacter vibrioides]YP_002517443.1 protein translocase subunit secD [Caulobacter vibrioides NA1000]QBQ57197.1 protein translocase subunit SecD [synthetic Caulobacter sp. 'ethensis']AAK23966.1 protein-export membrane protein SecD [Caulobacter vibrioides CB15]ACL95535.1 protein translocase subunit secD [Caulobacter vibrioides NA1000]ATC28864.1 protein translocase subunit SecD [Caulobacter vibrioides]QXZ50376.1 protein translocase subunit SecD [Caulobacter
MLTLSRWKIVLVTFSVIFGILFTLPNLLPQKTLDSFPDWLPKQKLNLGLDLQGGSYLMYEVDTDALRKERLKNLVEDVRTVLRGEQITFGELAEVNGTVRLRIADAAKVDEAANLLRRSVGSPFAGSISGRDVSVDKRDDQRLELSFIPEAAAQDASMAVDQSIETIRRRIDTLGTKEPNITRQGADRIVIQAAGESDPERLKAVVGKTAKLTFQMVDDSVTPEDIAAGRIPPGSEALPSDDRYQAAYVVRKRALVSGDELVDSRQSFDDRGAPAVSFKFNGSGSRKFGDATARNVGKRFAIVLDGRIISAPTINGAILGGSGIITGSFTAESASDLALLLRSGALPAPLKVEQQNTVGAELGADAVRAGAISTLVAFITIVVFMILSYGLLFGGISVIALIINGMLIVAAMSLTQATLTLPGIAGLILTLAVAVDANVLIYERMRDEARAGKSPILAADAGFSRAMTTIIDANVTTLVAAGIMFAFGAGPVRGFAWTLSIGVFTSVFTAVLVSQLLIGWWFRAARPKKLPI